MRLGANERVTRSRLTLASTLLCLRNYGRLVVHDRVGSRFVWARSARLYLRWCSCPRALTALPGVFTELIQKIGVQGVQVEELYSLDDYADLVPIYGFIFLFKWDPSLADTSATIDPADTEVFFAQQVINNACATQAILSVLMNVPGLDLGDQLGPFLEFARALPADMRGAAISNLDLVRTVHNSFARPEPFVMEETAAGKEDDVFHFIAYVPVAGVLYELDGLKRGPVSWGPVPPDDWVPRAREVIQARIERYASSEIRFNLLAIVQNRSQVLQDQRAGLISAGQALAAKLVAQGGILSEAQRALFLGDVQPMQTDAGSSDNAALSAELAELTGRVTELDAALQQEAAKREAWRIDNVRRRHSYVPFIVNMLRMLAESGKLEGLIDQAKQAPQRPGDDD